MNLTAHCERDDGWWVITVPGIRGLHTQVRRLDQVEAMVKDAAALLFEQPEESFTVTVVPQLAPDSLAAVEAVKRSRRELKAVEAKAARDNRTAVAKLRNLGLTVRDIGTILGVSPQRAHRIATA